MRPICLHSQVQSRLELSQYRKGADNAVGVGIVYSLEALQLAPPLSIPVESSRASFLRTSKVEIEALYARTKFG